METRTVHYGDTSVKINSFRSYKAFVAGDILGSASEQINELIEDYNAFRREYREKNKLVVTRAEARAFGYEIPDEEWGDAESLSLPTRPDTSEIFFKLFPKAKQLARKELIQLLGLVVVPNAELEAADGSDDDDAVPLLLEAEGKKILFQADLKETLTLVEVAVEVVKEQLDGLSDVLGKIQSLFTDEKPGEPSTEVSPERAQPSVEVTRSPGSETEPGSSTSSPPSTTGADERSTSVFAGES